MRKRSGEVFEQCAAVSITERDSLLERLSQDDPEIRAEVRACFAEIAKLPTEPPRLGKYRPLRKLGDGELAEVFLARAGGENGFERLVSLKRPHRRYTDDPAFREAFAAEVSASAKLAHPNIARVLDLTEHEGLPLLVREYVPGKSVGRLLTLCRAKWRSFPPSASSHILLQACRALEYAHGAGIIHGGITPYNILVSTEATVKIVDFGAVITRDCARRIDPSVMRTSRRYAAPEVFEGARAEVRSDLFSLALVFYELLTTEELDGTDGIQQRLSTLPNPELKQILKRGLAHDPAERFPSAREMGAAIEAYLRKHHPGYGQPSLGELQLSLETGVMVAAPKIAFVPSQPRRLPSTNWNRPIVTGQSVGFRNVSVLSAAFSIIGLLLFFVNRQRPADLPERMDPSAEVGIDEVYVGEVFSSPPQVQSLAPVFVEPTCVARIESIPPSAQVLLGGVDLGKTPLEMNVPCRRDIEVRLERSGYQPFDRTIRVDERRSSITLSLTPTGRTPAVVPKKETP